MPAHWRLTDLAMLGGKIEAEFTKQSRCFDYCLAKWGIKYARACAGG